MTCTGAEAAALGALSVALRAGSVTSPLNMVLRAAGSALEGFAAAPAGQDSYVMEMWQRLRAGAKSKSVSPFADRRIVVGSGITVALSKRPPQPPDAEVASRLLLGGYATVWLRLAPLGNQTQSIKQRVHILMRISELVKP